MALSRRQFFRRFWNPNERSQQERTLRYGMLESYVRTSLLPYDFPLTEEQYSELFEEVRLNLEATSDEDLFMPYMYDMLDTIVQTRVQPWREARWLDSG